MSDEENKTGEPTTDPFDKMKPENQRLKLRACPNCDCINFLEALNVTEKMTSTNIKPRIYKCIGCDKIWHGSELKIVKE